MTGKTILVIDDDKATRDTVGSVLAAEGYGILKAADGEEGIQALLEHSFVSLILLDMMMPRLNGWGFLDFARASKPVARVPIVVMSAYTEIARSVHPRAVVPKPVNLDALLRTVAAHAI